MTSAPPPAPQTPDVVVSFQDVDKSYDGQSLAVRALSLDVRRGEFLTLLGPSGSGKTTTLMMLAGFEAPTHGDILLGGRSLRGLPPHRRDIGVVFQNYALFPHMTVAENLAFPLSVRKVAKQETAARTQAALEMVRMAGLHNRYPGQLSGGQQQRVALARALVFEPQLVLMDEPLGALDRQLREHMQIEIKHLHEALGVTMVYVTHDQGEALTMSDRIAVFNNGALQQLATPAELYEAPANAFVAQFIGETNRFTGTVRQVQAERCLVELSAGQQVWAWPVNADGVGSSTLLSLRPERVVLNPDPGSLPNCFEAIVRERIYQGDHTRVRLTVAENDEFILKLPNTGPLPHLANGVPVTVGWRAEDCKALAPPPQQPAPTAVPSSTPPGEH